MGRRLVAGIAAALALSNVVGTTVARRRALPGRPLGVRWPAGRPGELSLWGTGISAPFALDGALLALAAMVVREEHERRARSALVTLGATVVGGHLAEPVTYRWARLDAGGRAAMAVNLALCGLLVVAARSGPGHPVPSPRTP